MGTVPIVPILRHASAMSPQLGFAFDTNVVIDWLVFDDPYLDPLRKSVSAGRVGVMTNYLARAEFARVLGYPLLRLNPERQVDVLRRYDALTTARTMPDGFAASALLLPTGFPHCRDRDDDAFLALAFHARVPLVTRDRALLKLRKRVRKFDLEILEVPELAEAIAGLDDPGARA